MKISIVPLTLVILLDKYITDSINTYTVEGKGCKAIFSLIKQVHPTDASSFYIVRNITFIQISLTYSK